MSCRFEAWSRQRGPIPANLRSKQPQIDFLDPSGSGRFDLPAPHGTCYLGEEPLGALLEVTCGLTILSEEFLAGRRLLTTTLGTGLRSPTSRRPPLTASASRPSPAQSLTRPVTAERKVTVTRTKRLESSENSTKALLGAYDRYLVGLSKPLPVLASA